MSRRARERIRLLRVADKRQQNIHPLDVISNERDFFTQLYAGSSQLNFGQRLGAFIISLGLAIFAVTFSAGVFLSGPVFAEFVGAAGWLLTPLSVPLCALGAYVTGKLAYGILRRSVFRFR
jgi:hypothetical protein